MKLCLAYPHCQLFRFYLFNRYFLLKNCALTSECSLVKLFWHNFLLYMGICVGVQTSWWPVEKKGFADGFRANRASDENFHFSSVLCQCFEIFFYSTSKNQITCSTGSNIFRFIFALVFAKSGVSGFRCKHNSGRNFSNFSFKLRIRLLKVKILDEFVIYVALR